MSVGISITGPIELPRLKAIVVGCQVTIANDTAQQPAARPAEQPQVSPSPPPSGQSIDALA